MSTLKIRADTLPLIDLTEDVQLMKKKWLPWIFPLFLLLLFAPLSSTVDLAVARYFFDPETTTFSDHPLATFIYHFGCWPANITFLFFLLYLTWALWKKVQTPWTRVGLLFVLTYALGSGLVVNEFLKNQWGRPRPKMLKEFGGGAEFHPFYQPYLVRDAHRGKSFPCGHVTCGLAFLSFAWGGKKDRNSFLFISGVLTTGILSLLLGYSRIAQGGHFVSDVLVSCIIMWWMILLMDKLVYEE